MMIGPIGFAAPWLLVALATLPVLWIILRAVPPAPIRRRFPGVALLLGLNDDDTVTDRTPWWLLLLRMLAVAALIIGLAGPVLNPQADPSERRTGPMLIVIDATWASARDWPSQTALIDAMLAEAGREARPAAILRLSDPEAPVFQSAEAWRTRLTGLAPEPWEPTAADLATVSDMLGDEDFETRWFSDGLARAGHDVLLTALESRGPVTVYESPVPIIALAPATVEDSILNLTATRATAGSERDVTVEAHGRDPSGAERLLATLPLTFESGATVASGELALPAELRARLSRFEIGGQRHAGAVTLTDDSLRRREAQDSGKLPGTVDTDITATANLSYTLLCIQDTDP
ncbi:MAG: BatA domain-containing protein, partial [Pseudomonadota bacterium]